MIVEIEIHLNALVVIFQKSVMKVNFVTVKIPSSVTIKTEILTMVPKFLQFMKELFPFQITSKIASLMIRKSIISKI